VSAFVEARFEAGQQLFAAGEKADRLYILQEGSIELLDGQTGKVFATLGPGEPFGEQAVLAGGVRSATARAREPSTCLELTADGLQQILAKETDLVRILFRASLLQLYLNNTLTQLR
jgi:CRP/FNR family transcriptional regulator, cyclic AMP receptor protein